MNKKQCGFDAIDVGDAVELVLYGEIDHHGAVQLRSEMDRYLTDRHPQKAVLELSKIDFMDSSGLGLIMGRYALMQRMGGVLTLKNPNPRVVKIFELAGLGRIVETEECRKEERT